MSTESDARSMEEAAFTAVALANLNYCAERGWVELDALFGEAISR